MNNIFNENHFVARIEKTKNYEVDLQKEINEIEKNLLIQTEKSFRFFKNWEKAAKEKENNKKYLEAAFLYQKAQDSEKAQSNFHAIAQIYQKKGLYPKAAFMFEKIGKLKKAAEILETWYLLNNENSDQNTGKEAFNEYFYKIIELYFKIKNKKKAYQLLIKYKKYEMAANLLIKDGMLEKAAKLLEKCHLPLEGAQVYQKMGNLKKAYLLRAEVAYNNNQIAQSAELFKKAGDLVMAAEQYESLQDWDKAAQCYEEIAYYKHAARCYLKLFNNHKAAKMLELAEEWETVADILCEEKDYNNAGKFYEKGSCFYKAGECFLKNNNFDSAVRNFQKVSKKSDIYLEAMVNISTIFLQNNKPELVISKLKNLEMDNLPQTIKLPLLYNLGKAYEERNKLEEASRLYSEILSEDALYKDVQLRLKEVEKLSKKYKLLKSRQKNANQRYRMLRMLGEGGMGVVYKAKDLHLKRIVAIKELKEGFANLENSFEIFRKEARAVASLSHPHIVKIFDFGKMNNEYFISMEYLEGEDLFSILKNHGKQAFTISEILYIAERIARALYYAHQKGVIHRDIKPHNILLTRDHQLKIMDFGIASILGQGTSPIDNYSSGTPYYMSPEQIEGNNINHTSDIYSAGVTIYQLSTGDPPFKGSDIFTQHLHQSPPKLKDSRPDAPDSFCKIILKCLQKNPVDRYNDCKELMEDLGRIELNNIPSLGLDDLKSYKKDAPGQRIDKKFDSSTKLIQNPSKTTHFQKDPSDDKSITVISQKQDQTTFTEGTSDLNQKTLISKDRNKTVFKKKSK